MDNNMNNKKQYSKKDKIIGIVFIIWFISSIIALIVAGNKYPDYVVPIFGQYFFVFGLIALFNMPKKDKLFSLPFLAVGFFCIVIPILMNNPNLLGFEFEWDAVIPLLLISAFVIAGSSLIYFPHKKNNYLKKVCYYQVNATVIDHKVSYNDRTKVYCPVYQFKYDGKIFEVDNSTYTNFKVDPIGKAVILKINPENPTEFLSQNKAFLIFSTILGVLFLAVSLPIFIYMIMNGNFIK